MSNVTMTERAVKHASNYLANRGSGVGIRLAIKTTGCSGLMYVIEPVDSPNEEDLVFEASGLSIFIDPKSLVYVDGIVMDYAKEDLNEGFIFKNPNVKDECGCGESFTVA